MSNNTCAINCVVVADTVQFQEAVGKAGEQLNIFQQVWNRVKHTLEEEKDVFTAASSGVTALSTSFKALHLAINEFIIAPIANSVNVSSTLETQFLKLLKESV